MNIGEFKLHKGRLLGWIATRTVDLPKLALRPVESDSEEAPAFEIVAPNVAGRVVQVGALWEETSLKGEVYYQGSIDDPSMPEKLPIALFGTVEKGFRAAWRRWDRRDEFGPAIRSPRDNAPSGSGRGDDYGFGDSTANENGELATESAASDFDDEVRV